MRLLGATLLLLSCGSIPAARLLTVYVAGRDAVSQSRVRGVHAMWSSMQLEMGSWSLRCLLVFGGRPAGGQNFTYASDPVCPELSLSTPDAYLDLGHKGEQTPHPPSVLPGATLCGSANACARRRAHRHAPCHARTHHPGQL